MSSIEDRIEFLEDQVRQLREAIEARSFPDVVQAKAFEVVNDEGRVLVSLSNLHGGGIDNGMIETRNSLGGVLVQMAAGPGGGAVQTRTGNGQASVYLGACNRGLGTIRTFNAESQESVRIGADYGGGGEIEVENGKGRSVVKIGQNESGMGAIATMNNEGTDLVFISASAGGGGGLLVTKNANGEVSSRIP